MSDQWEGRERRIGRPPLGEVPLEITLRIRVSRDQFERLKQLARDNQHDHIAPYVRELIDDGVLESHDKPLFSRAS